MMKLTNGKLFLDDVRDPYDKDWTVVRNYDECIKALSSNLWDEISLDHDLADEHYAEIGDESEYLEFKEKTGFEVVKWIVENDMWAPRIIVHSWNPVGGLRMADYLNYHKPKGVEVLYIPYNETK